MSATKVHIGFVVSPEVKSLIIQRAKAHGWSLSSEARHLLFMALDLEQTIKLMRK